jgi:hypothetical protein
MIMDLLLSKVLLSYTVHRKFAWLKINFGGSIVSANNVVGYLEYSISGLIEDRIF